MKKMSFIVNRLHEDKCSFLNIYYESLITNLHRDYCFIITVFINYKSVCFNCTFYIVFLVSFLSPKLRYILISL